MKQSSWVVVATLFALLAALWLTVGSWFAANQMGATQVSPLLGWGLFTLLLGLFAASAHAACKASK